MSRVAIIGTREYTDLERVTNYVRSLPEGTHLVVSGADPENPNPVARVATEEAKRKGFAVETVYTRPDLFGSKAAMMRGRLMVERADRLVAFDTGADMTWMTINYAAKLGREVLVWP